LHSQEGQKYMLQRERIVIDNVKLLRTGFTSQTDIHEVRHNDP